MKVNILLTILISLVFGGILLFQCGTQGVAVGDDDIIYVFADSVDWPQYKDVLENKFNRFVRTPAVENQYILQWISFKNFKNYEGYKNIFILGRLNSNLPVSANVRNLLNEEIIEGIQNGKYFYIPKKDVWVNKQYVLFLVAQSLDEMIQKIVDLGDLAYQDFRKYYFQRLKERMFKHMEQKKIQEYIENNYPFTIRVQHDYFIADGNVQEKYLWIRRMQPDRSIFIRWFHLPENFELTSRWIIDERNKLADQIYAGDIVVEDETKAFSTQFKEWDAIRIEGIWRNDSLLIGGPFRNITFIDDQTERVYMIDYYVQAIGRRKVPFLDQLNVIVHTFDVLENPRKNMETK